MLLCHFEKNQLVLNFPYDAELIIDIKNIEKSHRRYDPKSHSWLISAQKYGHVNKKVLSEIDTILTKWDFKIHKTASKYLDSLKVDIVKQEALQKNGELESKADDAEILVRNLGGELRPFQRAGVNYMAKRRRVLLGDEMGLGKTVQAIATIVHTNAFPCLVLCPVSLQLNWIREFQKWAKGKVANSNPEESADVIVVPYSRVTKNESLLSRGTKWKSLICDESHYLKNNKAQRTKSVKNLSKKIEDIYLLSGTPIVNRPAEFIPQLQILRRLNELGGWKHFTDRYCNAKQERFGLNLSGASNLEELNSNLRSTCYIRRFKKDVLKELPEKQRSIIPVNISNRKEYESSRKSVRDDLKKLRKRAKLYTEKTLQKLNRAGNSDEAEALWKEVFPKSKPIKSTNPKTIEKHFRGKLSQKESFVENSEAVLLINKLKIKAMQGKLSSAVDWINTFVESQEKLVVFCEHKEAQRFIYNKFQKISRAIFADMDTEERQRNVDSFQKQDAIKLIVCSLGAGGVGFTMTASSSVLFIEQGWTPAIHDQAEDRVHRIGQKNLATAYYLLGKDTIDEDIYDLIDTKRQVVSAASDGGEEYSSSLVQDLLERVISDTLTN